MRIAGDDAQNFAQAFLRLSGVSLLALTSIVSAACAGDRTPGHESRCAAVGEGIVSTQGLDGCFKAGTHVRVEAPVMQGSARLSSGLPGFDDGAAPAAMRYDGGTTRLRMRPMPGDVFAR